MHPKVLIVGTVPYNEKSTSRAFDAYFHFWEKENLAQIFSNTKTPCKGHCQSLYQITDYRMVKRWFNRRVQTGEIYTYENLPEAWESNNLEVEGAIANKAYTLGGKHTAFTHLMRGVLWRKKYWCTDELNQWLEDFKPECVFLSFSDDYFINWIALYVAKKFDIPIVSSIGDDYYFNKHFSLSPIYNIYKETYKALIRKVLAHKGSAIYISDKIRDKYNAEFGLDGETVYLASTIERKPFDVINKENPVITYFGNIRMGRNHSLLDIADALKEINPNYKLEVYSNEHDETVYDALDKHENVLYKGSVPYQEVQTRMLKSDITIIVEGFEDADIECSRYSLSTKAADTLASGAQILTYGSSECGIIEYMQSTGASAVCTNRDELADCIVRLLNDTKLQEKYYEQQIIMTKEHHNLNRSCEIFENIVNRVIAD